MAAKKLILRKEYFGGIFRNTALRGMTFLKPEEYESKKRELIGARKMKDNVKVFDATERGYPLLENAVSSPLDLHLELTKRCNGSCKHCFANSIPSQSETAEIMLSDLECIIRQLSDLGGTYVRLTGGEPTIRDDFFDIIDVINEEGLIIGLNTNGMFGEKTLDRILSRDIKEIRVSLDGPEGINNQIRTKGSYERVLRTFESIAGYNRTADQSVDVTMNVVLMRSNQDYIEEMIELAQSVGSRISFGLLRLTGRARRGEMLAPQEVVAAAYRVQQARERLGLSEGAVRMNYDIFCVAHSSDKYRPFPFDNSKCPVGVTGFTIDACGRVVPCGFMVDVASWVGDDARGRDLLDLWHNSKVLKAARRVRRPTCAGCQYHKVKCNGGCPVMAYVFHGDIDGRDPYCVRDVESLE